MIRQTDIPLACPGDLMVTDSRNPREQMLGNWEN